MPSKFDNAFKVGSIPGQALDALVGKGHAGMGVARFDRHSVDVLLKCNYSEDKAFNSK